MARKPVLVGLMVLLLSGAALGVAWQLRPPERLLSKRRFEKSYFCILCKPSYHQMDHC